MLLYKCVMRLIIEMAIEVPVVGDERNTFLKKYNWQQTVSYTFISPLLVFFFLWWCFLNCICYTELNQRLTKEPLCKIRKQAVTAHFSTLTATPITWKAEVYCVPLANPIKWWTVDVVNINAIFSHRCHSDAEKLDVWLTEAQKSQNTQGFFYFFILLHLSFECMV